MDLPIGFGDRVDPQQAGLALFGDTGGLRSAQTVAVDAAVYTACATWMPCEPNSRAMLWLIIRRPAFAAAK